MLNRDENIHNNARTHLYVRNVRRARLQGNNNKTARRDNLEHELSSFARRLMFRSLPGRAK